MSFALIAEEMGMCRETARKLFREGYQMAAPAVAEEERELMVRQYERFIGNIVAQVDAGGLDFERGMHASTPQVPQGSPGAAGLDAARKFEVTAGRPEDPEREHELAKIVRELQDQGPPTYRRRTGEAGRDGVSQGPTR